MSYNSKYKYYQIQQIISKIQNISLISINYFNLQIQFLIIANLRNIQFIAKYYF